MTLFIYARHFPLALGPKQEGVAKAVHGLAIALAESGMKVTVLCEGNRSGILEDPQGYEIHCFANPKQDASFQISPELCRYLQTEVQSGDRVLLNGIFNRSVYGVSRELKKLRIPYIIAPHDPYHPSIFRRNAQLKYPYWWLFERRLLRDARAVQVLDPRHAEWIAKLGIKTPVVSVPNGFDAADILPEERLVWDRSRSPQLFFLGRMDTYNKGLDLLIEAFAKFPQRAAAHLTIQGPDWGDRAGLEAQAQALQADSFITFLDPDYQHSPSELALKYDIFCITSRFEGFSLSALEAMLAGRVLLVSEVAGIAPHVQASGCGVVVDPQVTSIQAGLQALLDCRDRWPEMGQRGRKYVLENLQWKQIAERAMQQYSELGIL
jgi:glycosyltransferase involved in cell wall biosynthesis